MSEVTGRLWAVSQATTRNIRLVPELAGGAKVVEVFGSNTFDVSAMKEKLPKPVFAGDTIWAESEILELRESKSNPSVGIVSMRCRGINQRREVVIEFKRTFMVYKRGHEPKTSSFHSRSVI